MSKNRRRSLESNVLNSRDERRFAVASFAVRTKETKRYLVLDHLQTEAVSEPAVHLCDHRTTTFVENIAKHPTIESRGCVLSEIGVLIQLMRMALRILRRHHDYGIV